MFDVLRCSLVFFSFSVRFRLFRCYEVSFHGRLHSVNLVRDILLVDFTLNLRGLNVTVSGAYGRGSLSKHDSLEPVSRNCGGHNEKSFGSIGRIIVNIRTNILFLFCSCLWKICHNHQLSRLLQAKGMYLILLYSILFPLYFCCKLIGKADNKGGKTALSVKLYRRKQGLYFSSS